MAMEDANNNNNLAKQKIVAITKNISAKEKEIAETQIMSATGAHSKSGVVQRFLHKLKVDKISLDLMNTRLTHLKYCGEDLTNDAKDAFIHWRFMPPARDILPHFPLDIQRFLLQGLPFTTIRTLVDINSYIGSPHTFGILDGKVNLSDSNLTGQPLLDAIFQRSRIKKGPKIDILTLNFRGCYQITDADIMAIAENCPNLTTLNLTWCKKITSLALKNAIAKLPLLTCLELGSCNVDDAVLVEVAKRTKLTNLHLSGCEQITSFDFLKGLTNLTHLFLSGCSQITIFDFLKDLTKLTNLDLFGCEQITDTAIEDFHKARAEKGLPEVKIYGR